MTISSSIFYLHQTQPVGRGESALNGINALHNENSSLNHHILQVLHLITFSTVLNSLEFVVKYIQLERTCKTLKAVFAQNFEYNFIYPALFSFYRKLELVISLHWHVSRIKQNPQNPQRKIKQKSSQDSYLILSSSICSVRLIIDIKIRAWCIYLKIQLDNRFLI